MQSLVNSIVFVPPQNPNSLQRVQLLQHRRHMSFTSKNSGERISYYHFDTNGNLVTKDSLERVVRSSMVVLFHHGNAEDLGGTFSYAQSIACAFGAAVVIYDYCGYGFSGFPDASTRAEVTEKSVYSDADHMYDHLLSLGYPAYRIVIVGRSVGGGPACYLAEKYHKECPVLVMHGTHDEVVPYRCSRELLEDIVKHRTRALQRLLKKREWARANQAKGSTTRRVASAAPINTALGFMTVGVSDELVTASLPPVDEVSVFDLYRRAYDSLPEAVRRMAEESLDVTAADVSIGVFHRWFSGCGHNNIKAREERAFSEVFKYFLCFTAAFSLEREALLSSKSAASVARVSGDFALRAHSEDRE